MFNHNIFFSFFFFLSAVFVYLGRMLLSSWILLCLLPRQLWCEADVWLDCHQSLVRSLLLLLLIFRAYPRVQTTLNALSSLSFHNSLSSCSWTLWVLTQFLAKNNTRNAFTVHRAVPGFLLPPQLCSVGWRIASCDTLIPFRQTSFHLPPPPPPLSLLSHFKLYTNSPSVLRARTESFYHFNYYFFIPFSDTGSMAHKEQCLSQWYKFYSNW